MAETLGLGIASPGMTRPRLFSPSCTALRSTDPEESLPQRPKNVGTAGLGFAKGGFQNVLAAFSVGDLRIGARFTPDRAKSLHAALRDAAQTIDRMPSKFMTYDGRTHSSGR